MLTTLCTALNGLIELKYDTTRNHFIIFTPLGHHRYDQRLHTMAIERYLEMADLHTPGTL